MAAEPKRGDMALKSNELVLDNIFKNYITRWFREKTISAGQFEDAKKEIDFLLRYKDEIQAEKLDASARKKDKANQRSTPSLPHNGSHGNSLEAHRKQIRALLTEIDNLKAVNAFLQAEIVDLSLKASKTRPGNNDPSSQNARHRQKISEMETEIKYWKEEIARMRSMTELDLMEKESQIKKLNMYLQDSKIETDSLRQRLRKVDGSKASDEYQDVFELSDPDRPTRLGTLFTEVYDNEWSEAFESLPGLDKDKRVRLLYGILKIAFSHCEMNRDDQLGHVKDILLSLDPIKGNGYQEETAESATNTYCIQSTLQTLRKSISHQTATNIGKRFIERKEVLLFASGYGIKPDDLTVELKKYASKCAELCWLMVICDPPMSLSEGKEKESFRLEMFRPYTRSLKHIQNPVVELHVWPALHLHAGGPVVSTGVAQPTEG